MGKDDQRVTLTKRLLREGLLRLMQSKELSKISVTELCAEAGINRATFYRHYDQPRDILNDIRRGIFDDIQRLGKKNEPTYDLTRWLTDTCTYFYENSRIMNILFQCRTDDDFVGLLNELYREQVPELRRRGYVKDQDDDSLKLGTYFLAGGIYYIIRQWLLEPIDKSPEEVAALIERFLISDGI